MLVTWQTLVEELQLHVILLAMCLEVLDSTHPALPLHGSTEKFHSFFNFEAITLNALTVKQKKFYVLCVYINFIRHALETKEISRKRKKLTGLVKLIRTYAVYTVKIFKLGV